MNCPISSGPSVDLTGRRVIRSLICVSTGKKRTVLDFLDISDVVRAIEIQRSHNTHAYATGKVYGNYYVGGFIGSRITGEES